MPPGAAHGDRLGVTLAILDLTDRFHQHLDLLPNQLLVLAVGDALLQFHQRVAALFGNLGRDRVVEQC